MVDILLKASGFILVIVIGYTMKQLGFAGKKDALFLSRVIMNVTLPCALIAAYSATGFDLPLATALLLGLAGNLTTNLVGFLVTMNMSGSQRACAMLNMSGYNIGTFALPFILALFPDSPVAYVLLFDMGNALMCLGGNYTLASLTQKSEEKITFVKICRQLFSSVPFDTYLILMVLSLAQISIPDSLINVAKVAGNANAFLAMLMIGLMLEISMPARGRMSTLRILSFRYLVNGILALFVYFVFPLTVEIKEMLVLCLMAPVSLAAPVFSNRLQIPPAVPAAVNSISIIIALIVMTTLAAAFGV